MVDLTILSSTLQAIDPTEFPAIDSLSATSPESGCVPATVMGDDTRRDIVSWTPELWCLLNWWISLFPPSHQTGEPTSDGTDGVYVVEHMATGPTSDSRDHLELGPSLAEIEESQTIDTSPPEAREAVLRVINMGNGMIDLFA